MHVRRGLLATTTLLATPLLARGATSRPTAPSAGPEPTCHVVALGRRLTTTAFFPDGYFAQARWKVVDAGRADVNLARSKPARLRIESVVDGGPDAWREHKRPEKPLEMRLVNPGRDIPVEAAQAWCRVVATMRTVSPAAPLAVLARVI